MSGWLDRVEAKLTRLRSEAEVDWVVLAQIDGSVAAASPGTGRIDLPSLAALAAGSLSASGEMMRLAGETRPPRHMVHRGEKRSLVVSAVGRDRLLLIGFSPRRRAGLVRALAERAASELEALGDPPSAVTTPDVPAEAELGPAVSDALDRILGSGEGTG